jgi:hypothetical protein
MSRHFFIACDGCSQEIDGSFQTRPELISQNEESKVRKLVRRDLCDACALRMRQVIVANFQTCEWLLNGFERGRK